MNYPDDEEIERTNKIIQTFNIKNGEQLTQLYLKSDVILLAQMYLKNLLRSHMNNLKSILYIV